MHHLCADVLGAPSEFVVAHCISADLRLGAGIARSIQERYGPRQELNRVRHAVGTAAFTSTGRPIYHLVTKRRFFHRPSYGALERCLQHLKWQMLARRQFFLAIPELGCGRDCLHLPTVLELIQRTFGDSDIQVAMYHYKPTWETCRSPQGVHLCVR